MQLKRLDLIGCDVSMALNEHIKDIDVLLVNYSKTVFLKSFNVGFKSDTKEHFNEYFVHLEKSVVLSYTPLTIKIYSIALNICSGHVNLWYRQWNCDDRIASSSYGPENVFSACNKSES